MRRGGNQGGTRKERLMRAKMKKKLAEEDNSPNGVAQSTFEDILQMSDLSEASLLDNLRRRYDKDAIYTYVGPILIAINPYKDLGGTYGEAAMTEYYGKSLGALPPHVFALADHAYTQLIQGGALDPMNQSIIISGESGAGKTETTKIIMQYLARATSYRGHHAQNGSHSPNTGVSRALGKLEERVLESNPLLESFGNAKTLRNDNSSRFGKFIEIQFDHHGKIVGAEIMNFLLEKTRIISQSLGERNYHIFYQLLAGADDQLRGKLQLKNPEEYEYLRKSQCYKLPSANDADEFATTKQCMSTIGITAERQERVFDLLAAVLHLGNLRFHMENDVCAAHGDESKKALELIASLLRVSVDALQNALLTRQLYVGGKVIVQQQNVEQVTDKRDALAKAIYSSLFLWLVTELNRTISRPADKWGFIGVLDIYGFEKFDWNTFEQLCINYANEKLQRHFNQHMLEVEQNDYTKEGIDWKHIDFQDNQQCLDLIEGKPAGKPGIFIALDDNWRLKGEEANKKFVALLHASFGRDPNSGPNTMKTQHDWYVHPKVDANLRFGIKHYAGEVIYDASGFNDKNNETLNDDMKELIRQSASDWVREIFDLNVQSIEAIPGNNKRPVDPMALSRRPSEKVMASTTKIPSPGNQTAGNKARNLREVSVGAQFRFQLQELMSKISLANPRYVRCIKPNEFKRYGEMNDADVARQLKYSGMMEAIQIRQRGFALREDHDVFFYDYQSLAPDAENVQELVEEISTMLGAGKDQWQLGKTKVFLKRTVALKLRLLQTLRSKAAARTLQKWCRNLKAKAAAIRIQAKYRQHLAKKELMHLLVAAHRIKAYLLMRVAIVRYKHLLDEYRMQSEKAVVIQRYARGFIIRNRNLLCPFAGLGPKELDEKIAELEASISAAAKNKQFEQCANLQKDLEQVVEARKKVRTAKEIDNEIRKLNQEMEDAAKRKMFARCAEIQKELEDLHEQRRHVKEDLNDLDPDELDERIRQLEKTISDAMKARDFEKCGRLQLDLDKMVAVRKQKQTPEELDAEIRRLNSEIAQLMHQKQFDKCAAVQKQIDELKRQREKFGPVQLPAPAPQPKTPTKPVATPPISAPANLPGSTPTRHFPPIATPPPVVGVSPSPPKMQASPSVVSPSPPKMPATPSVVQGTTPSMQTGTVTTGVQPVTAASRHVAKPSVVAAPIAAVPAIPAVPVLANPSVTAVKASDHGRARSGSTSSAVSAHSHAKSAVSVASTVNRLKKKDSSGDSSRTVERLRPAKPLTVPEDMSVFEAAKLMKSNRAAAVIIVDNDGSLSGIFTDTDTARRVVSKGLNPVTTLIGSVMTPQPKCVASDDSAAYALDMMLTGRFRHLPVVSADNGNVVGVLNVAKCLHDAIRRIETSSSQLKQELGSSSTSTMLRGMLEKMLSPSLQDVLTAPGEVPAPLVNEQDSIWDVSQLMAAAKKPALVVTQGPRQELVGIFTPKDLLHRVIAAGLDVTTTSVGDVMTPDPESTTPDTTVLDAFHIMHDGKFLNLPVVSSSGEIHGIADVLSLAVASFGQSESRDMGNFWNAAFDLHHHDNNKDQFDDNVSVSGKSTSGKSVSNASVTSKARQRKERDKDANFRPVSSLRPTAAVTINETATVLEAAVMMSQKRSDALLVIDGTSGLAGILTDTDICRRVLAADLEPECTPVSAVMTKNIKFVAPEDSAIDALLTMQDGHFRHLPVVSRDGMIVGVLNIGKCIYDVSKRLEHAMNSTEQLKQSLEKSGASSAIQQLLGPMLQKLSSPTLGSVLENEKRSNSSSAPRIRKGATVKEVAKAMASSRKAALIVDGVRSDRLAGLFSPFELVMKVIAKSLDPATTRVEDVMLSDPEIATPTTSVLEGLHIMHDSQCLNIPVVVDGTVDEVAGLVDVLALSYGTIETIYGEDREQMQQFWNTALQLDQPVNPSATAPSRQRTTLLAKKAASALHEEKRSVAQLRPSRVLTIAETASVNELARMMGRSQSDCVLVISEDGLLVGIITDTDLTRRVVSENKPLDITLVGDVMTKNPKFVASEDPAIDALCSMLEGKFRHLPVVDAGGSVVGILNIGKCLYDAIRKMEKSEQSNAALRQTLEKEMKGRGGRGNNTNLSMLLGPMMEKIFSPDVKSVIDQEGVEPPRVQPYTSVYEVSKLMAATKKAALVVSNRGQYFGLFTPKDMLERVLARGLPVHTTPVCEVMSENAVTIYGSTSVIDAMHSMHDNKTLYLGVLQSDSNPQAVGLVDVLSLSYGSFAKGNPSDWKAFWNASFDAQGQDDEDDDSSVHSFRSSFSLARGGHDAMGLKSTVTGDSRPVSKLRPTKTVTILDSSTVADAAREMGVSHTDAALVISSDGVLRGILTDTDVTRRVVALGNDPNFINVCDVMTPNPKFVDEKDSAMDAMFMMLEGRFRHLPVVDAQGMVAGMLRIQKCLYDAITRLEKAQQASSGALREKLEKQLMASGIGGGLAGNGNAMQNLLGPMVEKLLSPTLETILKDDQMPPLVRPTDTVMEVARQMAAARKAALIVEDAPGASVGYNRVSVGAPSTAGKRLIGVFTPKDLLLRVVGSGLDAAMTTVSQVMTPNPETASPKTSLVDALHVMDEHKFLHLPVVEGNSGTIVGMVDVLSLCYGTFAKGGAHSSGGGDSSDWKSFWDMSLALARDDDERSDNGSMRSASVAGSKASRRHRTGKGGERGRSNTATSGREVEGALRPVSKLRPRPVTRINEYITVAEAARLMRQSRVEAVVITTDEGELRGILTDTDVTRRVLAKEIDPDTCSVSSVMTSNPSCVRMDDPAIEAITKMLEGRFKHLPVVGVDGIIQGMLDISKCLYDAISCMEKVQQSTEAAASEFSRDLGSSSSLQRLLGPMMEKMVRPTVAVALDGEPKPPVVQLSTTVTAAAKMMASTKKAAVVLSGRDVVGMLTPKDLLRKLVAKGLDASVTAVEEVMTSDPESLGPNARILDGLRLMHDAGQLFMPVLTETGEIYGMADVLCLSYGQFTNSSTGSGGGDWRQFWQTALNLQDEAGGMYDADDAASVCTIEEFERNEFRGSITTPLTRESIAMGARFTNANAYAELGESVSVISAAQTTTTSVMMQNAGEDCFVFKVSDKAQGHYHRIMCRYDSINTLFDQVRAKVHAGANDEIRLKYEDDDGDLAVLTTDESLMEAVNMAKRAGWKRIVLLVDVIRADGKKTTSPGGARRKLTKVEEDEDEDSEEEKPAPKPRKRSAQGARPRTSSGNAGLLVGASVVLVGLSAAAVLFLKKKN